MRTALALFTSAITLIFAAPAVAQDHDSNTVYGGLYNNYVYQDLGIYGSTNPTFQDGFTHTSVNSSNGDTWVSDGWISAGDTKSDDPAKPNTGALEVDLTEHYTHQFKTSPIGPIVMELTGAYYFFNFQGLGNIHDDVVDLHADFGRPFLFGKVTLTPFIRYTRIQWVAQNNHLDFLRPGARISFPITEHWAFSADGSDSHNATHGIDIGRGQADLTYDFGHGLNLDLRGKITTGTKAMIGAGFSKTW